MDLAHAHGDARSAITAVESIQRQLETAVVGFITIAAAEGWTADEIDADLQRFGFCLEPTERAAAGCACH
jgi:hypothetical protein